MMESWGKVMKEHDWCILRVVVGLLFIGNGIAKLFFLTPAGVAGFFQSVGIPGALFFAWLVSIVELLGGIAILIGYWVRPASLLLSVIMLVAILVVHLKDLANWPMGFNDFMLRVVLLGVTVFFMFKGAGKCCTIEKEK